MRWLVALSLLLVVHVAPPAQAQDAADSLEDTLRAALAAYEAGDLARARSLLEEVHAREPSARTLRGLGVVAFRQERDTEAVVLLEASLESAVKPLTPAMAEGVKELLRQALGRVTRLSLAVEPEGARVLVDGAAPARDLSGALLLSPGNHLLELSAAGHAPARLEVTAVAGETLSMKAQLSVLAPLPSVVAPVPALAREAGGPQADDTIAPRPERAKRLRTAAHASLALAGAALVTTVVATGLGLARENEVDAFCRRQPGETCTPAQAAEQERRQKLALLGGLSIGGAVVTGVAGLTGGALYWAARVTERGGRGQRALAVQAGLRGAF